MPSEVIVLRVQHLGFSSNSHEKRAAQINVTLKKCPIGFSISSHPPYKCDCIHTLLVRGINCDIQKLVIHREPPAWIGYHHHHQNTSSYQLSAGSTSNSNNSSDSSDSSDAPFGIVF